MKLINHRISLIALLPLLAGFATGCGPSRDDDTAEDTVDEVEDAAEEAAEDVEEGVEEATEDLDDER